MGQYHYEYRFISFRTQFCAENISEQKLFCICKDASASLEPKIPKSHQEQATDAVNSLLEYKLQT